MKSRLIIPALFLFLLGSCLKQKEFPLEPAIQFEGFTLLATPPDTIASFLRLSIRFTDGDGDIGLYDNEQDPPYDYNLFIDIFKRVNGVPELIIFPDTTVNFNGRIPILFQGIANKPMEGIINYNIDYLILREVMRNDTISFDVSIRDRALNHSNIIRTPDLIVL